MNSNITASLPTLLVKYIDEKAKDELISKSDVIRRAILKMQEDDFWEELQKARQELKDGRYFTGDLKDALKQYRKMHGN